jgi:hypothetical protein
VNDWFADEFPPGLIAFDDVDYLIHQHHELTQDIIDPL